ncbi:MAG: right-handed parallel beta-helix repeat-containing protein, partial [Anaerolineales bacterium]|nr:right-handed parallel beta-helix repeat-containing protein [Anaerolineales bacterium]
MKKSTTFLISKLVVFVLVAFTSQLLLAQDVILIEKGIDDSGNPTLFNAIMADTTATGERAHPNATYRLSRGQIYPVEAGLRIDFDITIDALDDDPDKPVRPPMIIPKADPTGNLDGALIWSVAENTMKLKNLMFNGVQNTIEKNLGLRGVQLKGGKTMIDNCVFTQFTGAAIDASGGNGYRIFVTNCIIRNIQNPTAWWEGDSFISWATNGDSLVFRNNTFFNNTGHIVNSNWEDAYTNYFEFSQNTVMGGNFNVTASFATTNGVFTDNLIVDSYAMGIDTSGQKSRWVDWDGLTSAIFPIDTNDVVKMQEELGLVEADRRMETHNNAYYWSDAVKAHWASRGAQFPDPVAVFMNERDLAMYADADSYPLLNESNNIEEDPMFTDTDMQAEMDAGYAKYGTGLFDSFIPDGPAFEG